MASIVDSFRDIFSDKYSFFKIIIFTIAIYYDYPLYLNYKNDPASFTILTFIIAFFLFGFLIKTTNNIINERICILPSLNPIQLGISSIRGFLAILPSTLISCFLANTACSMLHTIEWFDYTAKTIIWVLAASVIISSYILFTVNEKIIEAYKLWKLSDKAGDIIVTIIVLIIQLLLVNAIVLGFLIYAIMILFGAGPILNFVISLAVVYNICAIGHYIGQMHYENVQYKKD